MAFERRIEHLRYRYGICLNDECPCCKDKSVLQIVARKEFVCPECGKTLREVAPPKQRSYKWVKWLIAALLIAGAAVAYYHFFGNTEEELIEPSKDEVIADTLEETIPVVEEDINTEDVQDDTTEIANEEVANTAVESTSEVAKPRNYESASYAKGYRPERQTTPKEESVREVVSKGPRITWGVYTGPENGLGGVIRVTASHVLDCRDGSSISLQPGDEIQQTKFQGDDLRQGTWIHDGERQFFTR